MNMTDNGIGMTPDEMTQNLVRADAPPYTSFSN